MMEKQYYLKLRRIAYTSDFTDGILFDEAGNRLADTLEPPSPHLLLAEQREGKGCIPAGTYRLLLTRSPKFGRWLPLLLQVPGFTGIRIHAGNTVADTRGCILPGERIAPGQLAHSQVALQRILSVITAAQKANRELYLRVVE